MGRGFLTAVVLGLLFCPRAAAQLGQIVYVDVDLSNAKDLADRPTQDVRPVAHRYLREQLTEKIKGMMPPCWNFQPLAVPPAAPVAAAAPFVIKIVLLLPVSSSPSTRQLYASVVLTNLRGGGRDPLHSQPVRLWEPVDTQTFINGDWQPAYDDIAQKFDFFFLFQAPEATKKLIDKKIPIARGLTQPWQGGPPIQPGWAAIPIDFDDFQLHCTSEFWIIFQAKGNMMKVAIVAKGTGEGYPLAGGIGRHLLVKFLRWENNNPYNPATDDPNLSQNYDPVAVYIKELKDGVVATTITSTSGSADIYN